MKEMTYEQREALLASRKYKPENLLDYLADEFGASSDSELAKYIGLSPPQVSNIRNKRAPLTPHCVVSILDSVDYLSIRELRKIAGLPKVLK